MKKPLDIKLGRLNNFFNEINEITLEVNHNPRSLQIRIEEVVYNNSLTKDGEFNVNLDIIEKIELILRRDIVDMKNDRIRNHLKEALSFSKVCIPLILIKILSSKLVETSLSRINIKMILRKEYYDLYLTNIFLNYQFRSEYVNIMFFKMEYSKMSEEELNDVAFYMFDVMVEGGCLILDYETTSRNLPYYKMDKKVVVKRLFLLPRLLPLDGYRKEDGYIKYSESGLIKYSLLKEDTSNESYIKIYNDKLEAANYLMTIPMFIDNKKLMDMNNDVDNEFLRYNDIANVFHDHEDIEKYVGEMIKDDLKESDIIKKMNEHEESKTSYIEFRSVLKLANVYSNLKLYFTVSIDWRGRFYYNEYPLQPQGNKMIREMINIYGEDNYIDLDVLASGYQIVGMITGDKVILKYTNVSGTELNDIYMLFKERFDDLIRVNEFKEISHDEVISSFDRKVIKSLTMKMMYTQGDYSRKKEIRSNILIKVFRRICNDDIDQINKCIKESVNLTCPSVKVFQEMITAIGAEVASKNINLMIGVKDKYMINRYPYLKQVKKSVQYYDRDKKKKRMDIQVNTYPIRYDMMKLKRSIAVNFIHMIDGLIMTKLILKCKKFDIKIFTIHDCVRCHVNYAERVKMLYHEACQEMIRGLPIRYFLKINGIKIDEYEILKEFEDRSLKCLEENKLYNPNVLK